MASEVCLLGKGRVPHRRLYTWRTAVLATEQLSTQSVQADRHMLWAGWRSDPWHQMQFYKFQEGARRHARCPQHKPGPRPSSGSAITTSLIRTPNSAFIIQEEVEINTLRDPIQHEKSTLYIKLCIHRLHNTPLDLNHTKAQCHALTSSKNSNPAEKWLHVIFWGHGSSHRLFLLCLV